ncbi:hypothetical protein TPHA_0A02740 [Tetrapisispora phaffii CBS 4417]|uniref:Tr-type G domain-containing protein n=1 Tax=Tetrapisispora phaffii (strain ATCC 24235 / CBS 4417 / NBRC 1672 / NRRL Y-8282 / UCD 70-5) TaxID=1071381 RepID=G8BN78_TETPH|nr:hypothetical protein TPHA_0A02740 [Tetrapisispora phaffii CBS 4417]CCE61356.1 hypothetical protein TPHA_0A02740 [Tetrapisispora phaffii CBS 4417]
MDLDNYDEFGNLTKEDPIYSDPETVNDDDIYKTKNENNININRDDDASSIFQNDNQNFGFPNDVEVLIETEDRESRDTKLVDNIDKKNNLNPIFTKNKHNIPKTKYDRNYMINLSNIPERVRNISVIGPLHSGKTSLVDLLVIDSHKRIPHSTKNTQGWKQLKYMDNTKQEINRGISIRSNGITLLLNNFEEKSIVCNILDTPGHVNFMDQVNNSLSATEYAIICIDIVEGVTSIVEHLIKQCETRNVEIIFVLNKIDRLILELKLPPLDTYLKLKKTVNSINKFTSKLFSPELNNIIFASSKLGFTFTIKEYVEYFYKDQMNNNEKEVFTKKSWGNYYYSDQKISNSPKDNNSKPTFVEFILTPLYKIITHTLSSSRETLPILLKREAGVTISTNVLHYDPEPLLKHVLQQIFRNQKGLIDSLSMLSEPVELSNRKIEYVTNIKDDSYQNGQSLLAHCLQIVDINGKDWSLVRIYKGSIKTGEKLYLIDTSDLLYDDSMSVDNADLSEFPLVEIKEIALMGGRYIIPITEAGEGNIVLIQGISNFYSKSATLYRGLMEKVPIFPNAVKLNRPVFKVFIEPMQHKNLPMLLSGLTKINKYYPGAETRSENTGVHAVLGYGELYMDCLMYSLREEYVKCELKISTPTTIFSESCAEESFASIPVTSTNENISLSISAQPMNFDLVKDLNNNKIPKDVREDTEELSKLLAENYGWDILAANNTWDINSSNAFVNDTLQDEVDLNQLLKYKTQILQGFHWAIDEGPLAEENINGIQFRLLNFSIEDDGDQSIANEIISMVRKSCYVGMLTAKPILLEPIYEVDVVVYSSLLPIVEELFEKRRGGRIYGVLKIDGTPLIEIRGQVPVIDSIGFETDLRLSTNGKGMCHLHFWNKIWKKVPGDVLNIDAPIPKLKPAPYDSLSRDFLMKTRRRKGISDGGFMSNDGPSLEKYIEPEIYTQLKEGGYI